MTGCRRRRWYSIVPAAGDTCANPARVSAPVTSASGLGPGSTRRKSFSTARWPKAIELFDCSAPSGCGSSPSPSSDDPAQLAGAGGGERPDQPADPPPAAQHLQERGREHRIVGAVEQRHPPLLRLERRDRRGAGRAAVLDRRAGDQRQHVGVGLALAVLDPHQAQVAGLAP